MIQNAKLISVWLREITKNFRDLRAIGMGLKTQGSSPQGDKLPREKKTPLPTTKGFTLNKLARTTTSYIQTHMILNEYLQLISHFKYSFDLKPNAELALRNCI